MSSIYPISYMYVKACSIVRSASAEGMLGDVGEPAHEPGRVLAAGSAFLAATLPDFGYHLTTTGSFATADELVSLGAFALEMVVVVAAMLAAIRSD